MATAPATRITDTNALGGTSTLDTLDSNPFGGLDPTSSLLSPATDSSLGSLLTPSAPADTSPSSSSGGFLSDLSSLGTDISSIMSSPLGELGTYAGLTAYGLSQAQGAQQQTQQEANQITTASQPFLTAGQSLLSQYQKGTLPSWAQSTVNFDTQEGQSIINSGQALQTIAQQNFSLYSSGNLKPADQAALDQQTAAEKQQIASQLGAGGAVDSSVAAAYTQQIDTNAAIQKQNILNSYYTTGDQAYNSWLTSTAQGAQLMNEGGQFAQSTFNQMLTGALGLSDIGMQGLTTAIGLTIQSDTQLSQEVSTLMSNIAAAYAYTLAGPGNAKSGGTSGGSSSGSSLLGSASNLLSDLLGGNGSLASFASGAAANGAVQSALGGGVASLGNVGDQGLASQLASEGFSPAGGGAATGAGAGSGAAGAGAGAAAGADALSAAGVGASASGGFATGGAAGASMATPGVAAGAGSLAAGASVIGLGALGIAMTGGLHPQTQTDLEDTALLNDSASGFKAAPNLIPYTAAGGQGLSSLKNAGQSGYQSASPEVPTYNGKPFYGNEVTAAQLWYAYKQGTGSLAAYQQYMNSNT
jgi:hypothetical protein